MSLLKWDRHTFTGTELHVKTIGIIGLGNHEHLVLNYAKALNCEVLAFVPYIKVEFFERNQTKKCSSNERISYFDVFTLIVPTTEETSCMIATEEFSKMKYGWELLP